MKKFLCFVIAILFAMVTLARPKMVKTDAALFNPEDGTRCLQRALDSGASIVTVVNMGKPYIVKKIFFRSNQEVIFEDGVKIIAKQGEFKRQGDCMFNFNKLENVVLRGQCDVVIAMNKKDYQNRQEYTPSEWRHLISLRSAKNITIKNLTLLSSGGDGVYVSDAKKSDGPCRNITLEKLTVLDHHRQGVSVISVDGLRIRDCKFNTTSGTAPQSGIDFEPNNPIDQLNNIVIEKCEFNQNKGHGIEFYLGNLNSTSLPVSIVIRNCQSNRNSNYGVLMRYSTSENLPVTGKILLDNCEICGNANGAASFRDLRLNGPQITFSNLKIDCSGNPNPAFTFTSDEPENIDGLVFNNVSVRLSGNPVLSFATQEGFGFGKHVSGELTVTDSVRKAPKKVNFAKLAKIAPYAPDLNKQKGVKAAIYTPKSLKSMKSELKAGPENYTLRSRSGKFCQYVPAEGEYKIKFMVRPGYSSSILTKFTLYDRFGTQIDKFESTQTEFEYTIHAHGENFYTFDIDTCKNALCVASPYPGNGFVANKRLWFINARSVGKRKGPGEYDFYFTLPAGGKDIMVEIAGEGAEWVSAELISPDNRVVDSAEKIAAAKVLTFHRDQATGAEIWRLHIKGAVEDHRIRLGGDVIPVLSPAPELVLINK